MDWRWPPQGLLVPIILAADVAYDRELFGPLASLMQRVLAPGGLCLMANGDRVQVPFLLDALADAGLCCTPSVCAEVGVKLYRIAQRSHA
jgi:hypothetical protein